jgi:small subunit ribosomal protein S1
MKQLAPSSIDEYIAEHKQGDVVSGRVTKVSSDEGQVELGEGIHAVCRFSAQVSKMDQDRQTQTAAQPDLTALTSMLSARWKSGPVRGSSEKTGAVQADQIRSFRITKLDPEAKRIELELV